MIDKIGYVSNATSGDSRQEVVCRGVYYSTATVHACKATYIVLVSAGDSRQRIVANVLIGGINGIFGDNSKGKHKIRLDIPDNK